MRFFALGAFVVLAVCGCVRSLPTIPPGTPRETTSFNDSWRFIKADPAGAERSAFDDSAWAQVTLPHTFNDVDTFDNWSLPGHRGEQEQWSGRTWYRKTFQAPAAWRGRKVFVEFEAARQVAEVWVNDVRLGVAKSGFTPFGFDLTPHLRPGERNVVAVMVDNRFMKDPMDPGLAPQAATTGATHPNLAQLSKQLMESIPDTIEELQADQIPWNNPHWHPAHGGLYRNAWLHVTDRLHVTLPLYSFLQTEGPYAYATNITERSATVGVEVPVRNDRAEAAHAQLRIEMFEAGGRRAFLEFVDVEVPAGATVKRTVTADIPNPRRWEPGYPHLYRIEISLIAERKLVDTVEVPLGIRQVEWTADAGLWVNGAHYKLHGWGQKPTNEWPGLGAAQPDWMHAFTLQLMRDAGANFVRWGHVPGGPAQIRAADERGIVTLQPGVDGEHDTKGGAWALRSATFRDLVVYYRNHPSIFIWEGGNQKVSREHAAELRAHMDRFDPHGGRAYAHRRADAVTAEFMDVGVGTEGGREIARLPVVEGEYNREESPRRVWDDFSPPNFGYPEARGQTYQLTSEQFAVNQVAHYVNKLGPPHHAGGANWIFSDSTSGGRVAVEVARASGEVDGVRLPKEAYFVTQVMFNYDPRVHIIGHWSYPADTVKTVYVVANTGGEVELRVNGRAIGRAKPESRFLYRFPDVRFEAGELSAVAFDRQGTEAAQAAKQTAGAAVALRLTAITAPDGWRADGADIVLFDVEAIDANGRRVPTVQQRVDFAVEGPGVWRGGYNSGRIDSINHRHLDLEAGVNRVAVRSTTTPGTLTLRAQCGGLREAVISVPSLRADRAGRAQPAPPLPAQPLRQPQELAPPRGTDTAAPRGQVGRYTKSFHYSGPASYIVHVETNATTGRNAYVDADSPFRDLPASLVGADWVQAANRDALYHAVDLMELTVVAGATVTIAHDGALPRPPWLTEKFKPTGERLTIGGNSMELFAATFPAETSLTLGPNTERTDAATGQMYVVLVVARVSDPRQR